ncbi:hypothetical protein LTR36_004970 [Oleoguttula mirabilis]|uniref:EamA domain-containing protein n=1 Tax=Oleoguttula mirabilis TaxID=1507867 RepID=A0AAV9JVB2_9PEZI|nr:hypothetical protein LTR36_004970 [Oleoguttula mirabilis]
MSLTPHKAEAYTSVDTELDDLRHGSRAVTPKLNSYLSTPLTGPIRPLSPDTISNLSADEYDQIRPSRSPSRNASNLRYAPGSPAPAPPPGSWRGTLHAFWIRNKGIAYMLCAQVFGCLMNVTTRLLEIEGNKGKGLHPAQILFARMGITMVLASGYMWYKKTPHFPLGLPEVRWLLVARGFGGFFGVFGMYYSLLYLPLADATVITFLAPALACWACSILIHEPFTRVEQMAALVSLVGVFLIAKPTTLFALGSSGDSPPATGNSDTVPSFNGTAPPVGADASSYEDVTPTQRLSAVGLALVGVLGAATAYTTIRWIGKRAHPLLSVNYFAAWCTLVSVVLQIALPGVGFLLPADLKEWGYLFFLGTCGFIMQFLLAAGLSYEKSSRATNITYTQMLFALTFDRFFFGHSPDLLSIAGSTLILGAAIYVATMVTPGKTGSKEQTDGSTRMANLDEEAGQGLISGVTDVRSGEDHDRIPRPIEEVQMRTLR